MGVTKEISWSLTRSKTLAECPRAAWFTYYVNGEKDVADRAYALNLTNLPMAAGSAVDYVIARALKAYRDKGEMLVGLADRGVKLLRKQHENSLRVVPQIRNGGRWDRSGGKWLPPFHHHYYGLDLGAEYLASMEDRVVQCLVTFEAGEPWQRLRESDPTGWHPLGKLNEGEIPSFRSSIGLRIWSSVDFAMRLGSDTHVIDWKTGNPSPKALQEAEVQLAVYAMWACSFYSARPEQIRVQAVWLQSDGAWSPTSVVKDNLKAVAAQIKAGAVAEEERLQIKRNVHGRP